MNLEAARYFYLRRVVGAVLSAIGLSAADRLARSLARRVYDLNTPARRLAESRLASAAASQFAIRYSPLAISSMYEHVARFWIETLFLKRLLRDSSWRRFVTLEKEADLLALARSPRGCLLATAYFGNPAVAAWVLGRIFRPVHVIVDKLAQPYLAAWQKELYADRWVRLVERDKAAAVVPEVLSRGGAVLMIAEHERRHGRAVPVEFLGRRLNCYPTLDRLARWFDVPVGVVTCRRRERPFSFDLTLHAKVERDSRDGEGAVVCGVLAELQKAILARPEQYLWSLPAWDGPGLKRQRSPASVRQGPPKRALSAPPKTSCQSQDESGNKQSHDEKKLGLPLGVLQGNGPDEIGQALKPNSVGGVGEHQLLFGR